MVDSLLESGRRLSTVMGWLFTAEVFSVFRGFPPQWVVMCGRAIDEGVCVCKASGDPLVGIELLYAHYPLVLHLPGLECPGSCHALLVSSKIHRLQPIAGEGGSRLSRTGPHKEVIVKFIVLG